MKKLVFISTLLLLVSASTSAQPSPNAPEARHDHSMLPLPDGSVLLIGGEDVSGHLFSDMYVFNDMQMGVWNEITPANDPPPARRSHAAWARDGKVYIHGGYGENNLLDDMWQYDMATNEWTQINQPADKPDPRYGHTVVSVNGKDYLYGGKNDSGTDFMDFWSYDPGSNDWQEDDDFHPPSAGHAIGAVGGTIYAYGGIRWNEDDYRDDTRYYDTPLGNSWTYTYTSGDSPGPLAFMFHTFMHNLANHCMYLFGGENGSKELQDSFYKFNMDTHTWYQLPAGPPALSHGSMAITWTNEDTTLVLFGGLNSSGEPVDENWQYNFDEESWEVLTAIDDQNNQTQPLAYLYDNYPNPFKNSTTISYAIREKSYVNLSIYNVNGQHIKTLTSGMQSSGTHEINWSANDNDANSLPYGIYFYNLKIDGDNSLTKKCFYFDTR